MSNGTFASSSSCSRRCRESASVSMSVSSSSTNGLSSRTTGKEKEIDEEV